LQIKRVDDDERGDGDFVGLSHGIFTLLDSRLRGNDGSYACARRTLQNFVILSEAKDLLFDGSINSNTTADSSLRSE
jgi:hypothetical protein